MCVLYKLFFMQYFPTYNKFSLYMQYWLYYIVYLHKHDQLSYESLCIVSTQEFVVYVIFFVGALFASLRNHNNKVIPMPTGMGKVMINISFCFSCFCFCICCSQRCRAKTLQIIILFSFMSFIYHIIMDVISIGFILFIEESRTFYISLTLLYMSLILFFVMLLLSQYFLSLVAETCLFINDLSTVLEVHLC